MSHYVTVFLCLFDLELRWTRKSENLKMVSNIIQMMNNFF